MKLNVIFRYIILGCAILGTFGLENVMASDLNNFIDLPLEPKQECYYSAIKYCEKGCGNGNWTARSDCAERLPSHLGTPPYTLRCYCKGQVKK